MDNELKTGFYKDELKEDLCLEPEDWTKKDWITIKEIFGLDIQNVTRIVIPAKTKISYFIDNEE